MQFVTCEKWQKYTKKICICVQIFFQTPPNGRFYESGLFLIRKFQSVVLLFVFHLEGETE